MSSKVQGKYFSSCKRSSLLLLITSQLVLMMIFYLSLRSWYTGTAKPVSTKEKHLIKETRLTLVTNDKTELVKDMEMKETDKSVYKHQNYLTGDTNKTTTGETSELVKEMSIKEPQTKRVSWETAMAEGTADHKQGLQSTNKHNESHCKIPCEKENNVSSRDMKHLPNFDTNFSMDTSFLSSVLVEEASKQSLCEGNLEIQFNSFAKLHGATILPFRWNVTARLVPAGKELFTFKDESLRTDDAEYVKPKIGLLDMYCPKMGGKINNTTKENIFLLKYLWTQTADENIAKTGSKKAGMDYEPRFTVAFLRNDYANLYNVMLQAYNIFIMLMVYHQPPGNMSLLVLDSHPMAETDPILQTLYGPFIRMGSLRRPFKFETLVLSLAESHSPLSKYWYQPSLPHLEDFRKFVYHQHNLDDKSSLSCKNLRITLLWRRNKVYHPRNLKGSVRRKIFNEAELYNTLREKYTNSCVQGFLLDTLPFREQLKVIRETDILIGMHGAGLIHSLFLPQTSGLIEMFPYQWRDKHPFYPLFQAVTRWRRLHYLFWENTEREKEMPHFFTSVDVKAILRITDDMFGKLCSHH